MFAIKQVTGNRIHVEIINESLSSIIKIPDNVTRSLSNHVKAKVLSIGSKVKEPISVGDIVLVSDYTGLRLDDKTRIYDVTPDSVFLRIS